MSRAAAPARFGIALGLALTLGLAPGAARAQPADVGAKPADADPDLVCLRFDGTWTRERTVLVESDLRTAFGRRQVEVCTGDGRPGRGGKPPLLLTLASAADGAERYTLALGPRGGEAPALTRELDLASFPADGRVLALVVAADELLQAARQALGASAAPEVVTPRTPPAPVPPPVAPPEATVERTAEPAATGEGRRAPGRSGAAVGFSVDHYGGGQVQLGPVLAVRIPLPARLYAQLAADAREGLAADALSGTIASRFAGGRIGVGRVLAARGDRLALSLDASARVGRLWLEGQPVAGSGATGTSISTWLAYAIGSLALDVRVGGPVGVRLAAGAGAPLLAQAATEAPGAREVTAASGLLLIGEAGVVVLF